MVEGLVSTGPTPFSFHINMPVIKVAKKQIFLKSLTFYVKITKSLQRYTMVSIVDFHFIRINTHVRTCFLKKFQDFTSSFYTI